MKRFLSLILVLTMALCFAACGDSTPATTDPSADPTVPAAEGYSFTYNGTKIAVHADAAPILAALGEPQSYSEETSCAFDGLDKTYFYGSFYLQTYPMGDKDYVFCAWFMDDSVTTAEGAYVGMSQAEVEALYGADSFNGTNAYVLTKGESTLTLILTDGAVSSIQYDAVVE